MTGEVLLSVCIPTFNRLRYLETALAALAPIRARIPTEIIVSDDRTTDGTAAFLDSAAANDPGLRVLHQPKNLGGFGNLLAVLSAARGRYCLYMADDDRLEPEGLSATIAWLEAHPMHAAVSTPVEGYDLVDDCRTHLGRYTPQPIDFGTRTRFSLIDVLCLGLIPEATIYRTAAIRGVAHDPTIYWSLNLLNAALHAGTVRFSPEPFYRAIQRHWPGELRPQLYQFLLSDVNALETIRNGMELILVDQPDAAAQPQQLAQRRAAIHAFITAMQGAALDFLMSQCRWQEFLNTFRLLAARQALPRAFSAAELMTTTLRAIASVVCAHQQTHGFDRIALIGLAEIEPVLRPLLREAGLTIVIPEIGSAPPSDILFLIGDTGLASAFADAGVPNTAMLDFAGLLARHDVRSLAALYRAPADPSAAG